MKKPILLLLFCSTITLAQTNLRDAPVSFDWKYQNAVFASLSVPAGFTEETENYREGIITYLRYSDGSYIVLHRGGMWKIPFFDGPEYIVTETKEESLAKSRVKRRIRKGTVKDADLYWREENTFLTWPPLNIGFNRVPRNRLDLFNKALDSYVPKTRKAQPNELRILVALSRDKIQG